jgi:hypothetical protein
MFARLFARLPQPAEVPELAGGLEVAEEPVATEEQQGKLMPKAVAQAARSLAERQAVLAELEAALEQRVELGALLARLRARRWLRIAEARIARRVWRIAFSLRSLDSRSSIVESLVTVEDTSAGQRMFRCRSGSSADFPFLPTVCAGVEVFAEIPPFR